MKTLRIFVSSPGDVSEERVLAERVLRRLGEEYQESVRIETVLWEHEPLFAHSGFQEQIPRPSQCDLVICVLWSRLGSRLPEGFASAPGDPPPTGTEFEVRDALDAYRQLGKPHLLIYRKTAAPQINLASGDARERLRQYEQLDEFCHRAFYDAAGTVIVAHHPYVESFEFERLLTEHARKWIERQVGEVAARPRWTAGSPYRGLHAFEAAHREIYFGRSQALSELMRHMRETETRAGSGERVVRFLLVQGMSGSGKSSLVRAGLLPLLEGRALEGIGVWRQIVLLPSDRSDSRPDLGLVGALAAALVKTLPAMEASYPDPTQLAEQLRTAPGASAARIDTYIAQEAARLGLSPERIRLVVFVDQLEELFSPTFAADDRASVIAILGTLAREGRLWVMATIRSDFAARLEEYPELLTATTEGYLHILGPPQPDELADMIREPALAAGLQWESRDGVSLDQSILREASANPESLPLLEYALDQLYERRDGRRLTFAAYEQIEGLKGGIAQSAESVLASHQGVAAAFPNLMRSLVSVDEDGTATRRYAPLGELPTGTPERVLLDALLAQRLCVADRRGRDAVASFAHEALIQSWPRLREWLTQEGALVQARDQLIAEARRWEQHGQKRDWLVLPADRIVSMQAVVDSHIPLPEIAQRFAAQSASRARRAMRIRQAVIISMGALAVAATLFGFYYQRERNAASLAIAAQFEAKAWDLLHKGELLSAVRYAMVNSSVSGKAGAESLPILSASYLETGRTTLLTGHGDLVRQVAFSTDGRRVLTASEDSTVRLWDTSTGREIRRLQHKTKVWQATFSPDGKKILSASADNMARVWDADDGHLLLALAHGNKYVSSVLQADFSPDGRRIVTVSTDGTAWIWDVATGHPLVALKDGIDTLEMIKIVQARIVAELRHSSISSTVPTMTGLRQAAFSPDGRMLVTSSTNGVAQVWDAETGRELMRLRHDDVVTQAVFSPDGRWIATTSKDHTARVWNVVRGQELVRLTHNAAVSQAAFSPDGRQLVTASDDDTARIWDVTATLDVARARELEKERRAAYLLPQLQRMKAAISRATNHVDDISGEREIARLQHDGKVREATFSADGQYVITASDDRTARIWGAEDGLELARLQHSAPVEMAAFSKDGTSVVTASLGPTAQLWSTARSLGVALHHDSNVQQAIYSLDGRYVLTASDDHTARVWEVSNGQSIGLFHHDSGVRAVAFSRDGSRILTVAGENQALIWDLAAGREIGRLTHDILKVRQATFSPDGRLILTCGEDETARIWDAASQHELVRLMHGGAVRTAAFSPDGLRVLTASADHTARIWDTATGRQLARLQHALAVRQAAFSSDGRLVVTASDDHSAGIWDSATGRQLIRVSHGDKVSSTVLSAEFSPDDRLILTASADGTARVWSASSGVEVAHFQHEGAVVSAAFSPDGRRVVTASNDHTVRIWDVASGHELLLLQRANLVRGAAFSPDGRQVLTAADNAARLWSVAGLGATAAKLSLSVCEWLPPNQRRFTPEEIEVDPLIRDVFLAANHAGGDVCAGVER